ncbi:MurR/RpiR family transcriptional regulator [Oceanobacillus kapialis]|uniref:MurR/RpiR family transcriptional regulator n=1 Tax=Oceanobacillus kapialis TaxID=481353 RepID=A0ABW5PWM3_9BACI
MVDFSKWNLSKSQQRIADYLHKNMEVVPYMNEAELAKACQISPATVSRFWKAIGFKNLREFKQHLMEDASVTPASKVESAVKQHEKSYIQVMLDHATTYIAETKKHLAEEEFKQAIDSISLAKNVHLYGAGSAQSLVTLLSFRLKRFTPNVYTLAPSGHEIFEGIIHIKEGDVLFIFGFVQASVEINVLLDYARKRGIRTILMTDLLVSPMLEHADHVLFTSRGDVGDFHSMVAPIALIESIVINVGKQMGEPALQNLHDLHEVRKEYQDKLPKK